MIGRDNPCYVAGVDCPQRHAGCAVGCPEWLAYLERKAREDELLALQNAPDPAYRYVIEQGVQADRRYRTSRGSGFCNNGQGKVRVRSR